MMDTVKKKSNILYGILLLGFITYLIKVNSAGLWYDEAIEYFYSKYLVGEVPGGRDTANIYERICSTYQPPLYNILMYLWLNIYDSEIWFRTAGIITTMIGAVGAFFAVREQTKDYNAANMSALIYIFTSGLAYYGLECAEYNLVACCVSWTMYFYIRSSIRKDVGSIIGFFVLSFLSVLSQYGAAFIILGLYISLLIQICNAREAELIKKYLMMTLLTGLLAVIPLVVFFLVPQMRKQGSATVDHSFVFKVNIVIDYFKGIFDHLWWDFAGYSIRVFGYIIFAGVVIAFVVTVIMFFKNKELLHYGLVFAICWTVYFFTTACSVYGYNDWAKSLGTNNLAGRYGIFLIPFFVIVFTIGVFSFLSSIKHQNAKTYKKCIVLCLTWIAFFSLAEIVKIDIRGWEKEDTREAVKAWYDDKGYEAATVVTPGEDAEFMFYLFHNDEYDNTYNYKIMLDDLICSEDRGITFDKLRGYGYLDYDELYYLTHNAGEDRCDALRDVLNENGFSINVLYDRGDAILYKISKVEQNG